MDNVNLSDREKDVVFYVSLLFKKSGRLCLIRAKQDMGQLVFSSMRNLRIEQDRGFK